MPSFYIFLSCSVFVISILAVFIVSNRESSKINYGIPFKRYTPTNPDKYSLLFLLLLGAVYIYYASSNSSFWHPDASIFSYRITSEGWAKPVIRSDGRFFPLGFQLFSFYARFTKSPNVFHVLNILHYFLSATVVWYIFKSLEWRYRIWPIITILLTTSIFFVSQSWMYMEREVMFFVSVFVLFYFVILNQPKWVNIFPVLCCAYLALFSKENALFIFSGFAASRIVFFWWANKDQIDLKAIRSSTLLVDIALLVFCIVFLVAYYLYITPILHKDNLYGSGNVSQHTIFLTFWDSLRNNRIFLLFVIFYPIRWALIVMKRAKFDPIWDCMLVGVFLFYLGSHALNLNGPYSYYFSIGDFVALLCFFGLLRGTKNYRKLIPISAMAIISLNLPSTTSYALAYKEMSIQNEQVLDFMKEFVQSKNVSILVDDESPISWTAEGVNYALRFRGVDVAREGKILRVPSSKTLGSMGDDPEMLELVYIRYHTFWFDKDLHLKKIQSYMADKEHYLMVYPLDENFDQDNYLQPYLFKKIDR